MRAPRRAALAFLAVASLAVALPGIVQAVPVQTLVDLAEITYKMGCSGSATEINCVHRTLPWKARIKPGTGEEDSLETSSGFVTQPPLDDATISWMADMHQTACGAPKAVDTFAHNVGAMTKNGEIQANIGLCHFVGGLYGGSLAPYVYGIVSTRLPPPTPGPTATPSPTPAQNPTPKPTAKPTAAPTAAAVPTGVPSSSPSAGPSAAPSKSPTSTPTPAPTETPIAPVTTGAAETEPPPVTAPPTPAPSAPTFSQSVLGISDVNTEGGAMVGSLLLALLMLLIIGFAGELFNNTVENNYTIITAWLKKGPLGWLRRMGGKLGGEARVGLLLFLALTALVSSFVDPNFGFDMRSLAEFLGFLVGLIVVLASFKLPMMLAHKRKTGELGKLRPLPWALIVAALFVLISRIGNLQPGYLYGIVLGAIFVKDVSDSEEGRETFYGSFWTLAAAVLAWLGLTWVRSLGYAEDGFGVTLLSTAFAATLVAGLEAAAFGLMPLRFMPGHAVYKWNRFGWALLFGLSVFAFLHLLIGPSSGYVSELSPEAFIAALGVFAGFGALSIVTWLYFRLRPSPVEA